MLIARIERAAALLGRTNRLYYIPIVLLISGGIVRTCTGLQDHSRILGCININPIVT